LLFDIRNANRASLPPIVNIVDLAKFRPHNLPTLQPLTTLPETCLELDHELAYSSIKVLWYFSSDDSSGETFVPYESMLHVGLSFILIFIVLAFTGSTFAPIVIS
jgi:hypothetical protein